MLPPAASEISLPCRLRAYLLKPYPGWRHSGAPGHGTGCLAAALTDWSRLQASLLDHATRGTTMGFAAMADLPVHRSPPSVPDSEPSLAEMVDWIGRLCPTSGTEALRQWGAASPTSPWPRGSAPLNLLTRRRGATPRYMPRWACRPGSSWSSASPAPASVFLPFSRT